MPLEIGRREVANLISLDQRIVNQKIGPGAFKMYDELIYVSSVKPAAVPMENWLPTNKMDQGLSLQMRIYWPELAKIKTWSIPKTEMIAGK